CLSPPVSRLLIEIPPESDRVGDQGLFVARRIFAQIETLEKQAVRIDRRRLVVEIDPSPGGVPNASDSPGEVGIERDDRFVSNLKIGLDWFPLERDRIAGKVGNAL